MFNKDSGLVKIWVKWIRSNKAQLEQCPNLDNLREVVIEELNK